jgi:hypothetical protein
MTNPRLARRGSDYRTMTTEERLKAFGEESARLQRVALRRSGIRWHTIAMN